MTEAEEQPATVEDMPLELQPAALDDAVDEDPPAADDAVAVLVEEEEGPPAAAAADPPEDVAFWDTELIVAGGAWIMAEPLLPLELPAAAAAPPTPLPGAVTEEAFEPVGGIFWYG